MLVWFFFFKQKTAYEMRISDWSSDVCSSDLNVDARPAVYGRTDLLADEQHRRLVAFALADHNRAVDRQFVQRRPHAFNCRGIGRLLVAAPDQLGCAARSGLGHADHLQHQNAVENRACLHHVNMSPKTAALLALAMFLVVRSRKCTRLNTSPQ